MATTRRQGKADRLTRNASATDTTQTAPSREAIKAQRALLKRSEDERVSLAGVDPADALRALLRTPPQT